VAIVWLSAFAVGQKFSLTYPTYWALLFFVFSLFLDFLHYLIATIGWGFYHHFARKGGKRLVDVPEWFNNIFLKIAIGKYALTILGYVIIAIKFPSLFVIV